MKKYTSDQILKLVRDEIDHSNRIIGRKRLSTMDYIIIGMVTEALKRDELNGKKSRGQAQGFRPTQTQGLREKGED